MLPPDLDNLPLLKEPSALYQITLKENIDELKLKHNLGYALRQCLKINTSKVLEWPSLCPDLNPIYMLKQAVHDLNNAEDFHKGDMGVT